MSESDLLAWNEANDYENENEPEQDYDGPVACTLVHTHDARCEAASAAEMTAEMVHAQLRDIVARIDGSFDDAGEGRCDVSQALMRTWERLTGLLSAAYGDDQPPAPIHGTEDGCEACGARWRWSPWASEADRSGRRHQHASECPGGAL